MKRNKIDFIYKYRKIDSNLYRTLVLSEIYFAPPTSFNDPFDSNIVPIPTVTRGDVEDYCSKIFPNLVGQKFQDTVDETLKRAPQIISKSFRTDLSEMRKRLSICCFSQIHNSSLMFSHYADGHRGVCLEFKVSQHDFYDSINPVQYPQDYPSLPFFRHVPWAAIEAQFLNKQREWAYEKEWRIIRVDEPVGFIKFPPDFLTSIIFGLETSDSDIEVIREIIKFRNPKINLFKCTKVDGDFDLHVTPIKA